MRDKQQAIWFSGDTKGDIFYLAVFNLSDEVRRISIAAEEVEMESFSGYVLEELWYGEIQKGNGQVYKTEVLNHGAKLFKIYSNNNLA
ncbi:MAG: hypothetical protein WCD89_09340 [Anaerocolumna sp.]